MAFRTKLDYSDNRQINQRERTNTILSGSTTFGVPYSALTTGIDTSTSGITEDNFGSVLSTFSGNGTTTIFTWYDPRMSLAEPQFSAITNSTSGITQESGILFVVNTTGTTQDGYNYNSTYSGLSFSFTVNAMYSGSGPVFSGTVQTDNLEFYSASSLDYTGRTIWIDNPEITRTNRLIVTNNPQVGYVLTCDNSEGEATWTPISGATSGVTYWIGENGGLKDENGILHSIIGTSTYSIIAGGAVGSVKTSVLAGILGGFNNNINTSNGSIILGGEDNTININSSSSLIFGSDNTIVDNSSLSGILGGTNNSIISANTSSIVGGTGNTIFDANHSVILGGNDITATTSNTVYMNNLYVTQSGEGNFYSDLDNSAGSLILLSGKTDGLNRIGITTENNDSIVIGVRGATEASFPAYGKVGDNFVYSSNVANGLNIISQNGVGTDDYIRLYAGNGAQSINSPGIEISSASGGTSAGNVGIGLINATEQLDVANNARFRNIGSSASAGALHYDANGVLTTNTSDVRMKDQIISIDSALDKVKQLRGVYYKWKEDLERGVTGNTRVGFIAQEVKEVIPELAFTNERTEDKLMGVHYQDVTAILVEAIKELVSDDSPLFNRSEVILQTQTIAAEDNNIELNFNGTNESSLGGGITVINGIDNDNHSEFVINSDGDWRTNNYVLPHGLIIPEFTPTSTNDITGKLGEITRDDNYLYIKTSNGWKRTGLETF